LSQHEEVGRSRRQTEAAESLRKVAELTTGLPEESPADARLRDRLELAADVLDTTAKTEEHP
jgi:hypothetical protein